MSDKKTASTRRFPPPQARLRKKAAPRRAEEGDPETDERLTRRLAGWCQGAKTVASIIATTEAFLADMQNLSDLGFELIQPVKDDGVMHLEKEG